MTIEPKSKPGRNSAPHFSPPRGERVEVGLIAQSGHANESSAGGAG